MKTIKKTIIEPLTSIRIIAAVWIYIHHITLWHDFRIPFGHMLHWGIFERSVNNAAYALDFFLMLSGFLMLYVYHEKFKNGITFENLKYFYFMRLSRLYPLHISTIFIIWILFVTNILDTPMMHEKGGFFLNVTLMNSWVLNKFITWNSPAWALSAEWFSYLLFPLLSLYISNIEKKYILLCIFLFFAFSYQIFLKNIPPPFPPYNYSHYITISPPYVGAGSLVRTLFCFTTGCMLSKLYKQNFLKNLNWDIIFIFVSLLIYLEFTYNTNSKYEIFEVDILLAIFTYSLANCKRRVYAIFSNKINVYLGKLSFAFYMLHYPFLKLVNYVYTEFKIVVNVPMAHFVGLTILLFLFSSFFYHYVEIGCQDYLRKKIDSLQSS